MIFQYQAITMFQLLNELTQIHSPSGEEYNMKNFIINYIKSHSDSWKNKPEIIEGNDFQDCLMIKFGSPKTVAFAHMDTTGFTCRYENQLVPIGSPNVNTGDIIQGKDVFGDIECKIQIDEEFHVFHDFPRAIQRGTSLTYSADFKETEDYIISPYLDNRVGIFNLLKIAETIENGLLVFSAWEEHGGGSVPYLIRYAFEKFKVTTALISDVTWITDGIQFGEGVVISMRDKNIPRKTFVDKVISIANANKIKYQLEVEGSGSSDGREIQQSAFPIDWCFIGPPETDAHSSHEKIHKADLLEMISFYTCLFREL